MFAESLQHSIRPWWSVPSLYGKFRAQCLPYKQSTELWGLYCNSGRILQNPALVLNFESATVAGLNTAWLVSINAYFSCLISIIIMYHRTQSCLQWKVS